MQSVQQHQVVIVGGGPAGLTLAAELALAHIDVAIVERRHNQEVESSRAGGLHARTVELLDQRGVAERFISQGQTIGSCGFAMVPLDLGDFPSRHNYVLALTQDRIEHILAAWVAELGVIIHRGAVATDFVQDEGGVDVVLGDGRRMRAGYLVGCDGARSFVRKHAGIEFPGWAASTSWLIAEGSMAEEPAWGARITEKGINALAKLDDGKRVKIVLIEPELPSGDDPTLDDLRRALVAVWGTDFGVHGVTWLSRFSDMARQAATYRVGRVLLAGDAAHVHGPQGGQGLNLGVHDAMNLGWKLASVVRGATPTRLLDTYGSERHPLAARVLENTMAQTALMRGDDRTKAAHAKLAELLKMDAPRKRYAGMQSGLDVHYDLGAGHALLGRRMPDLELDGPVRVFSLLHEARGVLLNLGAPGALGIGPWGDRVRLLDARYSGAWELPVIGSVTAPSAVLIRPDGHVAWVGDGSDDGLREALTAWFGA